MRQPPHRTAEVGAVDGEGLELIPFRLVFLLRVLALVADEDAGFRGDAIPGLTVGIVVQSHQPGIGARIFRVLGQELLRGADGGTLVRPLPHAEEVAEERGADDGGGDGAERVGQPEEEVPAIGKGGRGRRLMAGWMVHRSVPRFRLAAVRRPALRGFAAKRPMVVRSGRGFVHLRGGCVGGACTIIPQALDPPGLRANYFVHLTRRATGTKAPDDPGHRPQRGLAAKPRYAARFSEPPLTLLAPAAPPPR